MCHLHHHSNNSSIIRGLHLRHRRPCFNVHLCESNFDSCGRCGTGRQTHLVKRIVLSTIRSLHKEQSGQQARRRCRATDSISGTAASCLTGAFGGDAAASHRVGVFIPMLMLLHAPQTGEIRSAEEAGSRARPSSEPDHRPVGTF